MVCGGVSDAVVVEVARVGDERLIISETLRLSLNVEILNFLRTKKKTYYMRYGVPRRLTRSRISPRAGASIRR